MMLIFLENRIIKTPNNFLFCRLNKLNLAITKLSQDQRIIIQLKHFENFTYKEISQNLNVSEKTVKSRLYSARMVLKDYVKEN